MNIRPQVASQAVVEAATAYVTVRQSLAQSERLRHHTTAALKESAARQFEELVQAVAEYREAVSS